MGRRGCVAGYHRRVNGVDRRAEDVLIGPGSKELMFILQLAFYGDLLVPSPSWVSYTPQAHIAGRRFHWIETQRENGWRLQPVELEAVCLSFPPDLHWVLETMAVVASESFTSTSAPIQYAAVRAFEGGADIDAYLARSRSTLRTLGPAISARLRRAGCDLPDPEGGFHLFPNLSRWRGKLAQRGIVSGRQLCERLLAETGVATLPGSDFGRLARKLSLRMAYVGFDGAAALAAVAALEKREKAPDEAFLWTACAPVMEGIERLAAWIEALNS